MFKQDKSIDRDLCFVLMPFKDELDDVYKEIRKVTIVEQELSCLRSDDIYSAGVIIKEIWDKIQESQIIIADCTGKNPNVLYEVGLAHAIGKDENVILIAQNMDDIPFDLRHRCIIIYSKDKLDRFAIVLSKTIDELKWKPIEIEQWISTDEGNLRVGLSFPRDKSIVHKTPIEAAGRVVGLSENDLKFWIQGFVITDREYQQGASMIDKNGFWKINAIHLGAVTHRLFFRIYDESGRCIANSEEITIEKRNF